jgi:hypothetical protein
MKNFLEGVRKSVEKVLNFGEISSRVLENAVLEEFDRILRRIRE